VGEGGRVSSERLALGAHVASLVAAGGFLFWLNRDRWFSWDEWAFPSIIHPLLQRGDVGRFLFAPYINHWQTIPNLIWEGLYRLVGLRLYWPYLIPMLAAHLGIVALLRILLIRVGAGPWLATGLTLPVLLSGAGWADLAFGWQVGFLGAVFFGLAQLLLTDHDGPISGRDGAGLVLGLAGLTCSAVSLAMVPLVGLSLALRRRWLPAAVAVAPLGTVFVAWYLLVGRAGDLSGYGYPPLSIAQLTTVPGFAWQGLLASLGGLAGLPGPAALFGVVALIVVRRRRMTVTQPGMPLAWAGAVAAVWFFATIALGRFLNGATFAAESRYLYVGIVLLLPLVAAALSGIKADRIVVGLIGLLLGWAVINNVDALVTSIRMEDAYSRNLKASVLRLAADPSLDRAAPNRAVTTFAAMWIDMGLIKRLRDEHELPTS